MSIEPVDILLVDDSEDDILIIQEALVESRLLNIISVVRDGEEALAYLRKEGKYGNVERPGLVLLDINMPKKNGFEVLTEMKADEKLNKIPVVMLTVSRADEDVAKSYASGACSFVSKPVDFDKLKEVVKHFELYWTVVAQIPKDD